MSDFVCGANEAGFHYTGANFGRDVHFDETNVHDLRNVVANIDDYKPAGQTVVHFAIAKDTLTSDDKAKLDQVATQLGSQARYFITVEGFTDQTGDKAFNDRLSRARAEQVISYLVGSHDVPVYRIHTVSYTHLTLPTIYSV